MWSGRRVCQRLRAAARNIALPSVQMLNEEHADDHWLTILSSTGIRGTRNMMHNYMVRADPRALRVGS